MPKYDLIIIGAGIAGMTAAIGAARDGIKKILIIEREAIVGGIINQFIHNGFGKELLGQLVTGPEYVDLIEKQLKQLGVEVLLNSTVLEVSKEKTVTYVNPEEGVKEVTARGLILAMGAKEKYFGNVVIPVNGLTGIFGVGEAHKIINLEGYLPGKRTVIIAKDKWAFIVARRLLIEGGKIEALIIEKPFEEIASKEIHNIIDGFDIPIIENSRVVEIQGKTRIEKMKIINLGNRVIGEKECDSLLLSGSFIPEISIIKNLKVHMNGEILGPEVVNYVTSLDGVFACGNIIYGEKALHMEEFNGSECGEKAANYINFKLLK
ncbi:NAD(P)/FAD-dependent oxidoreductase [Clostridium sp.]|uniref:NAD(P)/FAD-dependent oxidoreductase n=1 Tax=Clostridium sp. TaxID=1506 RepID=UPI0028417D6D|nr:NAD(P)/FAD-dependent oxidoreductase [Clostridium sp.]MDR3598726.1 NAD(P)/FAD-dependent oxidoreductase [Clostridium sp.]